MTRVRLGKMFLFWMQFGIYWIEMGCSFLQPRKWFLLYIYLNQLDTTGVLLYSLLVLHALATWQKESLGTSKPSSTKWVAAVSAASNFSLHSTCPSSGRNTVPWTEHCTAFICRKTKDSNHLSSEEMVLWPSEKWTCAYKPWRVK